MVLVDCKRLQQYFPLDHQYFAMMVRNRSVLIVGGTKEKAVDIIINKCSLSERLKRDLLQRTLLLFMPNFYQ
jgi:hypothetical protein